MNKNAKVTGLDPNQIIPRMFDEDNDAQRVTIVDGANITLNANMSSVENKLDKLIELQIEPKDKKVISSMRIEDRTVYVDKPFPVQEIKVIEVPHIIKEIEYKTIEIPIVVKEFEIIEKPVIVYKDVSESKSLPMFIKVCLIMQTLAFLGMLLVNIIKK